MEHDEVFGRSDRDKPLPSDESKERREYGADIDAHGSRPPQGLCFGVPFRFNTKKENPHSFLRRMLPVLLRATTLLLAAWLVRSCASLQMLVCRADVGDVVPIWSLDSETCEPFDHWIERHYARLQWRVWSGPFFSIPNFT